MHALRALIGALGEAAQDQSLDFGWKMRPQVRRRHRLVADDHGRERRERLGDEGRLARHDLVQHHPHRPNIGAVVHVSRASHLFRRHVGRSSEDIARSRQARRVVLLEPVGLRDAEVEYLHVAALPGVLEHHDVLGLQIPVNHPDGVAMCDGNGGLQYVVEAFLNRQRAALFDHPGQRRPEDEFHHHERRRVIEASHLEDLDHVIAVDGFAARASRMKRSIPSALFAARGGSSLMATLLPRSVWIALTTAAMPPAPSNPSTRYRPARTVPGSGTQLPDESESGSLSPSLGIAVILPRKRPRRRE